MSVKCAKCSTDQDEANFFCSNCGFDVVTGSINSSGNSATKRPKKADLSAETETKTVYVQVSFSKQYYDLVVSAGEVEYPTNATTIHELSFTTNEITVGRFDEDNDYSPDIDLANLTYDIAVSVNHCTIKLNSNGELFVVDNGSTNGTFVGLIETKPIETNKDVEITKNSEIFLGAWTRLVISM